LRETIAEVEVEERGREGFDGMIKRRQMEVGEGGGKSSEFMLVMHSEFQHLQSFGEAF
jgi:hypothetical protein